MNNVRHILRATRNPFEPRGAYSESLLAELLVLHEEMLVQLRLQSPLAADTEDFLKGMIAQHEKAAAMLRAQLKPDGKKTD